MTTVSDYDSYATVMLQFDFSGQGGDGTTISTARIDIVDTDSTVVWGIYPVDFTSTGRGNTPFALTTSANPNNEPSLSVPVAQLNMVNRTLKMDYVPGQTGQGQATEFYIFLYFWGIKKSSDGYVTISPTINNNLKLTVNGDTVGNGDSLGVAVDWVMVS